MASLQVEVAVCSIVRFALLGREEPVCKGLETQRHVVPVGTHTVAFAYVFPGDLEPTAAFCQNRALHSRDMPPAEIAASWPQEYFVHPEGNKLYVWHRQIPQWVLGQPLLIVHGENLIFAPFVCLFFWIFIPLAGQAHTVLCCAQIFTVAGKPAQVPEEIELLERSYPSSRAG